MLSTLILSFSSYSSFRCIRQSLEDSNRCPKCNYIVDNVDQLYPNFLGTFILFFAVVVVVVCFFNCKFFAVLFFSFPFFNQQRLDMLLIIRVITCFTFKPEMSLTRDSHETLFCLIMTLLPEESIRLRCLCVQPFSRECWKCEAKMKSRKISLQCLIVKLRFKFWLLKV